jgi:hypothetical protein
MFIEANQPNIEKKYHRNDRSDRESKVWTSKRRLVVPALDLVSGAYA